MTLQLTQIYPTEWIFLLSLGAVVLIYAVFLVTAFRRSTLDDLECSKYTVFSHDPFPEGEEVPQPPLYCQLNYARDHKLLGKPSLGENKGWIWLVFAIWFIWISVVIGAFLSSHLAASPA